MKILKPGKVEMRKFVCPRRGCVFVARDADFERDIYGTWVICPQEGCERNFIVHPDDGEPYEEPTPTQGCIDRLTSMIADLGYVNETVAWNMAVQLIEQGVTFREG